MNIPNTMQMKANILRRSRPAEDGATAADGTVVVLTGKRALDDDEAAECRPKPVSAFPPG